MVAKSEASMPMSRALAKLAVATDVGTAARPSTAAPAMALSVCPSGSVGVGVRANCKEGMGHPPPPARSLALKPSAARNVLASLPQPLASTEHQHHHQGNKINGAVAPPPAAAAAAAAASGVLVAAPTTPRLPPLPSHSSQPSPPQAAAAAATVAAAASSQFPSATPPGAQQSSSMHHHHDVHQHAALSSSSSPLPPCGIVYGGRLCSAGATVGSSSDFSRELLDAARNHPGLPSSLLAQLHRPRRPGAPSSAPFACTTCTTAATGPPSADSASASAGGVRPLSPRSRARLTASLVNGTAASGVFATTAAAAAALSPEALAVILGTSSQPPSTPAGLLVMRRAGPAALGAGAALRPSTAHQGGGGSVAAAAAPAGSSSTSRPPVMPHITVPYKPGSIRLPTGGVPGLTAAIALGGLPNKGASGTASVASSGTGSPIVPSTAAGPAASEALRPWTAAAASGFGSLRPTTANPLTHSMPLDTTKTLVVRMPRPATEAPHAALPTGGAAGAQPPSRGGSGSYAAGRTTTAASRAGAGLSAAPGVAMDGGSVAAAGGGQDARQLTAQELRSVVAALAAARPEAAAMLTSRMATPALAAAGGGNDTQIRPVTGRSRRPTTGSVGDGAATADAAAQGPVWDVEYTYGRVGGNPQPGSSRTSSRASTRGSLLSGSAISIGMLDPSVFDDKWPPTATSGGSRPGSRGALTGTAGPPLGTADSGGGGGSRASNSGDGRRPAISAWGSKTRTTLQAIPEEAELDGGEEGAGGAAAAGDDVAAPLPPLETLDPDPELDSAWASIVAANQRPDTAVARSPSRGINVFSRLPTGAIRITRQAGPMVLVLEDIAASTPEVLERELETLSLEELQALRTKLCACNRLVDL